MITRQEGAMMRVWKGHLYARLDEIMLMLGAELVFFAVGELMFTFVAKTQGLDGSVIPIGTLCALMAAVTIAVFMGIGVLPVHFNMAVSMGITRNRFIPVFLLVSFAENLAAAGVAFLFSFPETWVLRVVYAGVKLESFTGYVFQWKYILTACLGLAALHVFFGMLLMRLGKIAWTVLWLLWMACAVGGPGLARLAESMQETAFGKLCAAVLDMVRGFTESGILAGIVIASVVMIAASWGMLYRQEVKM